MYTNYEEDLLTLEDLLNRGPQFGQAVTGYPKEPEELKVLSSGFKVDLEQFKPKTPKWSDAKKYFSDTSQNIYLIGYQTCPYSMKSHVAMIAYGVKTGTSKTDGDYGNLKVQWKMIERGSEAMEVKRTLGNQTFPVIFVRTKKGMEYLPGGSADFVKYIKSLL